MKEEVEKNPRLCPQARSAALPPGARMDFSDEPRTRLFRASARRAVERPRLARPGNRAGLRHRGRAVRGGLHAGQRPGLWRIPPLLRRLALGGAADDTAAHGRHRLVHIALLPRRRRFGHSADQGGPESGPARRAALRFCLAAAHGRQDRAGRGGLRGRPFDRARGAFGPGGGGGHAACAPLALAQHHHRWAGAAGGRRSGRYRGRLQCAAGGRGLRHRGAVGPARGALQRPDHHGHRAGGPGGGVGASAIPATSA